MDEVSKTVGAPRNHLFTQMNDHFTQLGHASAVYVWIQYSCGSHGYMGVMPLIVMSTGPRWGCN